MRLLVDDLTVEHSSGGYAVRPLDGLSFRADAGQVVLLLGASGSGKTTLLSVLAGLLRPTGGSVVLEGTEVTRLDGEALVQFLRHGVGIVFQDLHLVPSLTASENAQVPLRLGGTRRAEARRRAEAVLHHVGLGDRGHLRPGELSTGQQQRLAIARALAHDPPVLLVDEPTARLDYVQVEGVVTLLRDLADDGRTVVLASHDDRLLPMADVVVELSARAEGDTSRTRTVCLAAGEYLFRQGDHSDFVYMVESGKVDVLLERVLGDDELVVTLGPGRHVGELGPLLRLRRSATARASTDCTLTAYTAAEFRSRVQELPEGALPPLSRGRRSSRLRGARD